MDDLSSCATVKDAFLQHGLAADDRIDRREQVLMFRSIESEIEKELKELMREGRFDQAKELGQRLEGLREEFGGLQLKDEMSRQEKQNTLFEKAAKMKEKHLQYRHKDWEAQVEQHCRCVRRVRV